MTNKGIICSTAILGFAGTVCYGYYRNWHPAVPKPDKGKKHIVCIGDSITFGAGVVPFQKWRSYPAYLQELLGKEYQVMNFGLSGRTLLSTGDMPYSKESHYAKAFQIENVHYLIMLGTNDSKRYNWKEAQYREELAALLLRCKSKGAVTVMKPPKAFPSKKTGEVLFDIQDDVLCAIGRIIDETARELEIPVIDLYAFTENHPEWFPDGVHPDAVCNQRIAEQICKTIMEVGDVLYWH